MKNYLTFQTFLHYLIDVILAFCYWILHQLPSLHKNSLCSYHAILCLSKMCFIINFIFFDGFSYRTLRSHMCESCYIGLSFVLEYPFLLIISKILSVQNEPFFQDCGFHFTVNSIFTGMPYKLQRSHSWKTL